MSCKKQNSLQKNAFYWTSFQLYGVFSTLYFSLFQIINCGEGTNRVARDNKEILQYEGVLIIERS